MLTFIYRAETQNMPGLVVIHGNLGEKGTKKMPDVSTTSSLGSSNRKGQLQETKDNMDMYARRKRSQKDQGRNLLKKLNSP
jgi:hypothetical protein